MASWTEHKVWVPSMTWHRVQCDIQLSTLLSRGSIFHTFNVILSCHTQPITLFTLPRVQFRLAHSTGPRFFRCTGAPHPSVGDTRLGWHAVSIKNSWRISMRRWTDMNTPRVPRGDLESNERAKRGATNEPLQLISDNPSHVGPTAKT